MNQTLLITLNWLKQPRAKVRTINIIYSIIRMKDVLSGGERERGEKEINSTLQKCSEKDANEILSDNRYGHLFIASTTKEVELEDGGVFYMN